MPSTGNEQRADSKHPSALMCGIYELEHQKQLEETSYMIVCSVFELVARLCARVDVIFVYVMQIRQKSSCPIH